MKKTPMTEASQCPVTGHKHIAGGGTTNQDWWPNQLKLELLHQHSCKSNPMARASIMPKSSRASTLRPLRKTYAIL